MREIKNFKILLRRKCVSVDAANEVKAEIKQYEILKSGERNRINLLDQVILQYEFGQIFLNEIKNGQNKKTNFY